MALSLSPPARRQLINGLTAFSAGTLFFIRSWYDLEHLQPRGLDYFRSAPSGLTLLAATIVSSLLLGVALWGAWYIVERSHSQWLRRGAHTFFLLFLMYPIEAVRLYWNTQTDGFDYGSNIALWIVEAILLSGAVLALRGNTRVVRPARKTALVLLLLLPSLMIDFLNNHFQQEQAPAYAALTPAPHLAGRGANAPRVVWVIFDELDQRIAFEKRPADLKLPELDRLRGESVSASHAVETATFTAIALPSLISGRIYSNAQAVDARHLHVLPAGSTEWVDWRTQPNVFTRARSAGVNSAMIGWHHPYCRVLGDEVVDCFSLPSSHSTAALAEEAEAAEIGVWRTVAMLYEWKLETLPNMISGRGISSQDVRDALIQRTQQTKYLNIRDRAYRDVADPQIGLVVLHLPTPHLFPIYNRREQNFHITPSLNYFDNLALVDRTLGELRHAIQQAGLADRTTILLTADHGLRPGAWIGRIGWDAETDRVDGRLQPLTVPFIVKLPGQNQAITVDKPFSNVAAADLSLAVLTGEVATAPQAAAWIDDWISHRDRDGAGVQAAATPPDYRSVQ